MASTKPTARDIFAALKTPNAWLLLVLGFSAGLPFLMTGATLGFWMREEGISLTIIGYMGWISLFYGFKVVWAPWMDKVRLPILHAWLGQRRSFMLLAQAGVILSLIGMAAIGPGGNIWAFVAVTLVLALSAASQEIAIHAWRIEQTEGQAAEALNPTLYSLGFKVAAIVSGSLILLPAETYGWPATVTGLAVLMLIGVGATLIARPSTAEALTPQVPYSFDTYVTEPLKSFFREHTQKGSSLAWWILATVALYRLPDYLIGPVAGPLYSDTGLSNADIAYVRSTIGLAASFAGVALGGACLLWLGIERAFWLGAVTGPLSNICFALMASYPGEVSVFGGTLIVDNIANGIAETAFIAFLTRLTVKEHTLTHFALMYSAADLAGKLLKGFSGQIVDSMTPDLGLFGAYQAFFVGTALAGIPALILCLMLRHRGLFKSA
ncbi:permease [Asticcacaulis sp. BYS171W]|uniref:Permease n=1 Tax=Asticcacaulis aquaticus TaxID=2984212 RepID=A0ABT5HW71_9CAUL|nr:permease [Asticcacaulis aquaticus]MDC7684326.1 permease [Asticcacaulis aquaticus]